MVTTYESPIVEDELHPIMPPVDLPEEDGIPLESDWHRLEINLLVDVVRTMWRGRTDFFAGGNMFVYYSDESVELAKKKEWRGPDFFVVTGVDGLRERRTWAAWLEDGRYPNLIVELLSASTQAVDLGIKKGIYEQNMRIPEYVAYSYDTDTLYGWRLEFDSYQPIVANADGRMWLETVQAWIGTWYGEYLGVRRRWLRFFDADGQLIPSSEEEGQRRAVSAEERAVSAEERAVSLEERAVSAEERAVSAEERARRLEALLRAQGIDPDAVDE